MYPTLGSDQGDGGSIHQIVEDLLGERIEALASWIQELDAQVRSTSASGDEKTLKELRRALEAWSKRDPKFEERLTDRVDVLADRLATLSSTVNTTAAAHAGSDGEIATLRRELEQESAKLHALVRERASSASSGEVEELRSAIAELSAARPRGRSDDRYGGGLQEKVDNLGERIDTLAKTVATTAAGLAGRDGELASLRKALEEGDARLEQMLAGLGRAGDRTELAELEAQVSALAQKLATTTAHVAQREQDTAALRARVEEEATKGATVAEQLRAALDVLRAELEASIETHRDDDRVAALDERVGEIGARLEAIEVGHASLAGRLDTVSSTVEGASADLSAKELELAALQRHLEETSSRFDSALAEVHETFAALPEVASVAELEERITPLQAQLDTLASRLVESDTQASERAASDGTRSLELAQTLAHAEQRLADIERGQHAALGEVQRASASWNEERAWVREQLDAMVAAVAETPAKSDVEPLIADVSRRVEDLAAEQAALLAEIARTRDASLAESARLEALLGDLPEAVAPIPPSQDAELERLLTAFADRIDAMEQDRTQITAEAARASQDELLQVRALQDGLRMRLTETEKRLAALAEPDEVGATIDELSARVAALEDAPAVLAPAAPLPGDGRFRVELRALELRMQHAEAAARENREAVLVQLERLASRIEWRLQRLEVAEQPEPEEAREERALGQVVPIRGGVET